MALREWQQWADNGHLYAALGAQTDVISVDQIIMVVEWQDNEWVDITTALVPVNRCPPEMMTIAMWSTLPEPDLALLEEQT